MKPLFSKDEFLSIMPARRGHTISRVLRKEDLEDLVVDYFRNAGADVLVLGRDPLKVRVAAVGWHENLIIYIWNISHGGKTRSPDEYRIQMKGTGLQFEEGFKTLLLGWYEDGVFAAFNASKHGHYGKSPSVQVRGRTLRKAEDQGIAFHTKELRQGQEIIVVFKPEHILEYVSTIFPKYHEGMKTLPAAEMKVLEKPLDIEISEDDLLKIARPRRQVIITINKKIREEKFKRVLRTLYAGRCAICGLQAQLTEAAHIIPVGNDGTDEIVNGVLLCRNHHKAYDSGLLTIDEEFVIKVNEKKLKLLADQSLDSGLKDFLKISRVGEKIYLPKIAKFYPKREYLRANCASKGF